MLGADRPRTGTWHCDTERASASPDPEGDGTEAGDVSATERSVPAGQGSEGRHRVVVVGGGFGGLPATRLLAHTDVDVTLIDRRNHHLFQPLLYQVATGILSPGQIAPTLRHLLRKHDNVQVEMAPVTGFDLDRRVVKTMTF